jgi:hypothetical protein
LSCSDYYFLFVIVFFILIKSSGLSFRLYSSLRFAGWESDKLELAWEFNIWEGKKMGKWKCEKIKILKSKAAKTKTVEVKNAKKWDVERWYMKLLRNKKDIVVVMIMVFLSTLEKTTILFFSLCTLFALNNII